MDGYTHVVDASNVRHAMKQHSNPEVESKRGQVALTDDDWTRLPMILESYDTVKLSDHTHLTLPVIEYSKTFEDGTSYYLEEVRTGRKRLATLTFYKKK